MRGGGWLGLSQSQNWAWLYLAGDLLDHRVGFWQVEVELCATVSRASEESEESEGQ